MKLLRTHVRVNPNDSLGHGLDAVITLVLFFGIGFFLDRWLGTTPWFMIGLSVLAGLGVFYKLKRGYESRMDQHERDRLAAKAERTVQSSTVQPSSVQPSTVRSDTDQPGIERETA